MSVDATRWAWTVDTRKSTHKLILLALADRAGEDHTCFPSCKRLEIDTKLNRKTILSAINELIELGFIEDTGERKGSNKGTRVLRLIGVIGREDQYTDTKNGTYPKIGTRPKNGTTTGTKNGMGTYPKNGIQNLTSNLKEEPNKYIYSDEPKKSQKFSFERALLKFGANKQFVSEFMEVRKAKKAVDSQTAFNRFISEQQKSGKSLDEVLEICIVNSWKSFNASWGLQNNKSVQVHNQDPKRGSMSKQKPFSDTKQDNVNRWRSYGEKTEQNDTLVTVNSEPKLIGDSHE